MYLIYSDLPIFESKGACVPIWRHSLKAFLRSAVQNKAQRAGKQNVTQSNRNKTFQQACHEAYDLNITEVSSEDINHWSDLMKWRGDHSD